MEENKRTCLPDYEAELKVRCSENAELKLAYDRLLEENTILCAQREDLLKKNESLERNIRFLEGEIEAFRYCIKVNR